jgi:aminoglycoside N3'-acetyltransferase
MELGRLLASELDIVNAESVCFHTDILALGAGSPSKGRRRILEEYGGILRKAVASRATLFPVFNYDYFKTRIYDMGQDRCQVGVLNEYFRASPDARRTSTPVFNFCVLNAASGNFSFETQAVPFSENSTFAEMCRDKTWMVFLGAPLARSTLIHLCDYRAQTGFRYRKRFPGVVRCNGTTVPVDFSFRVRVLHPLMPVTYDWERLEKEMLEEGIVKRFFCQGAQILFYRADLAVAYWSEILRKDELGFYTPEGRRSVQKLYDTVGYPLTLEMFEEPRA